MSSRKIISQVHFILLISFFLGVSFPAFCYEEIGKVINVNYDQTVAYTDLGNRSLSIGEDVQVDLADGETVVLKVVGISDKFSKLKIDGDSSAANVSRFRRIKVGDDVLKRMPSFREIKGLTADQAAIPQVAQRTYNQQVPDRGNPGPMDDLVRDIQDMVNNYSDDNEPAVQSRQRQEKKDQPFISEDQYQILVAELNNYKVQYRELQDKYDELNYSSLGKSEQRDAECTAQKKEIQQYKSQQGELNQRIQTLVSQLEQEQHKIRESDSRFQINKTDRSSLNAKINQLTGEVDYLKKMNIDNENEIKDLQMLNDRLKTKMNSIINMIDQNI